MVFINYFNFNKYVYGLIEYPSCTKCRWFVPNHLGNEDLGLCKMHKNTYTLKKNMEVSIYDFAKHCRNDENLCGQSGYLYDEINETEFEIENLNYNYDMLNDDKDIRDTLRMIEKFNKRHYYK